MKLRLTKNQSILIRVLLIPPLVIKLSFWAIDLLKPTSILILVFLVAIALALYVDRLIAPLLQPQPKPDGQEYWINQSVSVVLPEGWSIEFSKGLLILHHVHTQARLNVRTRDLSPAQIRDKILTKLDEFYHD